MPDRSWDAFEDALALADVGAWTWVPSTDRMRWSDRLSELLGGAPENEPPSLHHFLDRVHSNDQADVEEQLRTVVSKESTAELECRVLPDPEELRWLQMTVFPASCASTPVAQVVGTVHDVTDHEQAKAAREFSRREIDLLLEVSPLALISSTLEGIIHNVNGSFEEHFGLSREAVMGRCMQDLDIWMVPQDWEHILDQLASTDPVEGFESRLRTATGEEREVELSVGTLKHRDTTRLLWAIRDVTERNRLQRQLHGRSFFDALTGLPVRNLLVDRADHAIERADREGEPLTLLYVDIDDFKAINEEFGHPAGDELLAMVAKRLKRSVRSSDTVARPKRASDTVARIAGDEFALLLEGSGEEGARVVANRLQKLLEAPFEVSGTTVHLSVSFGLAVRKPEDEELSTGRDLLRVGETAIYAARQDRKDIHVIRPEDRKPSGRLRRREELMRALRWDEFTLYYQPIVDLQDQSVAAAEALLRWVHPEEGLLPPAEFIPLAKDGGLIEKLDRWVLRHAIRQAAHWRHVGEGPPRMCVNVSGHYHSGSEAQQYVLQLLEEQNLPGEALTLETTEHAALRHTHPFDKLRQAGVRLSIDDFGTGYSALFYRHRFDADVLKIDRGFINAIDSDKQTDILIQAMIEIADHLDMASVAEGVETKAQLQRLRELGCAYAQGYYFARPMPADAFEEYVEEESVHSLS